MATEQGAEGHDSRRQAMAPESGQRSGMGKPSSKAEGQAGTLGHSAPFQPGRKGG